APRDLPVPTAVRAVDRQPRPAPSVLRRGRAARGRRGRPGMDPRWAMGAPRRGRVRPRARCDLRHRPAGPRPQPAGRGLRGPGRPGAILPDPGAVRADPGRSAGGFSSVTGALREYRTDRRFWITNPVARCPQLQETTGGSRVLREPSKGLTRR